MCFVIMCEVGNNFVPGNWLGSEKLNNLPEATQLAQVEVRFRSKQCGSRASPPNLTEWNFPPLLSFPREHHYWYFGVCPSSLFAMATHRDTNIKELMLDILFCGLCFSFNISRTSFHFNRYLHNIPWREYTIIYLISLPLLDIKRVSKS